MQTDTTGDAFSRQDAVVQIAAAAEPWALRRTMWVIQVTPSPGQSTLLQAEAEGGTYVLCYTTDAKAVAAIAGLEVPGARSARVPLDCCVEFVTALCQVGAIGIIVDLDPETRRCAFARRITATA